MFSITDAQLGKVGRQMAEVFRLLRDDWLDVDELLYLFREIIQEGRASRYYSVYVNHERSIEEGVKAGAYDKIAPGIDSDGFPEQEEAREAITIALLYPDRPVSTGEVLQELNRHGYRPATIQELLSMGETYPDAQRRGPIIGLGSRRYPYSHRAEKKDYLVPVLTGTGTKRAITLFWTEDNESDYDWTPNDRFAVVRIEKQDTV